MLYAAALYLRLPLQVHHQVANVDATGHPLNGIRLALQWLAAGMSRGLGCPGGEGQWAFAGCLLWADCWEELHQNTMMTRAAL